MQEMQQPRMGRMRRMLMAVISPPESLDRRAERAQRLVGSLLGRLPNARRMQRFLHGRAWLGHPLHPALTDLVTGAWTVAWVLDLLQLFRLKRLQPGADAAVKLGLLGVPLTALSGLTDWQETRGRARRLGLVHAALNILTTLIYVSSMRHRANGRRMMGMLAGHVGFLIMNVSAYLGGEMVYDEGVNVERGASEEPDIELRQAG